MKRAMIIHGWGGFPQEGWFPWLKKELEKQQYEVTVPSMPDTNNPIIKDWVGHLAKVIGKPDKELILIGHSIGCQTIMRYLETIDVQIKAAIYVAGWFSLSGIETAEEEKIAHPWLTTPLNFKKIKKRALTSIALFSDDDPFVPLENVPQFKEKLGAQIMMEKNQGHLNNESKTTKIPSLLKAITNL